MGAARSHATVGLHYFVAAAMIAIAAMASGPAGAAVGSAPSVVYLQTEDDPGHFARLQAEFARKVLPFHPRATLERRMVPGRDPGGVAAVIRTLREPAALVVAHTLVSQVAARELPKIPITLLTMADPSMLGFSREPGTFGANVTGYSAYVPFHLKHLELLRECVPGIRRVGVIGDPFWADTDIARRIVAESRSLFGLSIEMVISGKPEELDRIAAIAPKVDGWFVVDTPFNRIHSQRIGSLIHGSGKPAIAGPIGILRNGGLLAYTPEQPDPWPRMAEALKLLLSGVPVSDIPFDRPKRFHLTVSRSAARALGLSIPRSILVRADEIRD